MQDCHRLEVWKRSMAYVEAIYRYAATLPAEERLVLAVQLRRAAVSVPLNIAEGSAASTNAEFARFVGYACRSLKEVTTCLELCQRLYPTGEVGFVDRLIDEGHQVSRMTRRLIQRLAPTRIEPAA